MGSGTSLNTDFTTAALCRSTVNATHVILMSSLEIGEDHPLSLELASLRATVARYQVSPMLRGDSLLSPGSVLIKANMQVSQ